MGALQRVALQESPTVNDLADASRFLDSELGVAQNI
jgi:hypothetical protein